jgi:hypothetical protein
MKNTNKPKKKQPLPFRQIATLDLIPMSECLLELIDPYRSNQDDVSRDELHTLVSAAIVAWNIATQPKEDHEKLLDLLISRYAEGPEGAEVLSLAQRLIQRKLALYPEDRRYPLDFKIVRRDGEYRLEVKSALVKQ